MDVDDAVVSLASEILRRGLDGGTKPVTLIGEAVARIGHGFVDSVVPVEHEEFKKDCKVLWLESESK
jgi:hypothetical protein